MAYRFFLGGRDLEMVEIRRLLDRHAAGRIEDKRLAWGAALSAYREELLAALARGETPVMIELADDLLADLFDRARVIVVDHHGPLAGHDRPTSIEQVFALLGSAGRGVDAAAGAGRRQRPRACRRHARARRDAR